MHFFTSITLVSSLVALSSAVPTLTERSTDFCPGQSHLTPDVKCSSGFIGCVAYEKGGEVCNGEKRFFNDCSGAAGLGSFFDCDNGFKGCSTNPRICDTKPSVSSRDSNTPPAVPSVTPGFCRPGEGNFYVCANGFKGCSTDPTVCDPQSIPSPPGKTTDCPANSSFFVCANGFKGCSSNPTVCDTPSIPVDPVKPSDPVTEPPTSTKCPKDTWYIGFNECSSGFVGCTSSQLGSSKEVCEGEKRFWGSCPAKHGNYYNCANGFVGCTTDVKVCDRKVL